MKYTNEKLGEAVKASKSWGQVYRALTGKTGNSGAMETNFKTRSVKLGFDFSHFSRQQSGVVKPVVVADPAPVAEAVNGSGPEGAVVEAK